MSEAYTPTAGMLRALRDAASATEFDVRRCRLRGLLDHHQKPTFAGQLVINRENKRRQELAGG